MKFYVLGKGWVLGSDLNIIPTESLDHILDIELYDDSKDKDRLQPSKVLVDKRSKGTLVNSMLESISIAQLEAKLSQRKRLKENKEKQNNKISVHSNIVFNSPPGYMVYEGMTQ